VAREWIRIPTRVLPAPGSRELPEPIPLRAMLGPSLILAGLSIGSGELVLWPRITAEWGFAVFWGCWVGVSIQFFLNMEIERWTLATGESAVVGFLRLGKTWGPVFLVCGTLPWIWPGWATGAATLVTWQLGGDRVLLAIAGLVLCALTLSIGPVVYRTMERIQTLLVATIFSLSLLLAALVVRGDALSALAAGALPVGALLSGRLDLLLPEGLDRAMLLGALAFAGAGGTVNLAQSNYIKDKGYGMGRWIGRITSPLTGREEAESEVGYVFEPDPANLARWRVWWRRTNLEHFLSFHLLCVLSLALFCLLAFSLLEPGAEVAGGLGFIDDQAHAIAERFGPWARHVFLAAGVAVLFSTELALLDAVARVVADILKVSVLARSRFWTLSRVYFGLVWALVVFGAAVLAAGFDEPLWLLVLSAALNGFVMFVYSGLLLWLNLGVFRGELRPRPVRVVALLVSLLFFGYFSGLTLVDLIS
jgi:hypothetical protein